MKIAIPDLNGRIAPRFGVSCKIKIFNGTNSEYAVEESIDVSGLSPFDKAKLIKDKKIEALICLGIENWIYHYLVGHNIKVIPGVTGFIDEIADRFFRGCLKMQGILDYGRPRIVRRRGRGGRRGHRGFRNTFF